MLTEQEKDEIKNRIIDRESELFTAREIELQEVKNEVYEKYEKLFDILKKDCEELLGHDLVQDQNISYQLVCTSCQHRELKTDE